MASASFLAAASRAIAGTTYYVSPTGSDSNSGTSPNSPWQTLTKVESQTYAPGSSILFQDGGNWYGNLYATSSGTVSQPITYGSYGSGADPIFWGSDILNAGAFQQIAGTPSGDPSYEMTYPTTVNSVLEDHQFLHSATLVDSSAPSNATPSTYVNYVESTPDTWYYDATPTADELYINTGTTVSATDGHVYTAAVRQNVVSNNYQSNLVFDNLTVEESAAYNGGYGFGMQFGSNLTVENSTAIATGKHAFAAIDAPNFLGENLLASNAMPDQGFGGATAFVAFSDGNDVNDASSWINDTNTNPGGNYPAFISHGDPGSIGSITIVNMNSPSGGAGISIETTSSTEQVSIQGGLINNGYVNLDSTNTIINGLTLTGAYAQIILEGNGEILQNSIITGTNQNPYAAQNGSVYVEGANDIIRFNTFQQAPNAFYASPTIGVNEGATNTMIYGNVIDTNGGVYLFKNFSGPASIVSNNNLFAVAANILLGLNSGQETFSQWQQSGQDQDSTVGNPMFTNAAAGNYYLLPGSPGLSAFIPTAAQAVADDFFGYPRPPLGTPVDLGALQSPSPAAATATWTSTSGGNWGDASNWSSGLIGSQAGQTVNFTTPLAAPSTINLNAQWTVGNVNFSGSFSYTLAAGTGGSLVLYNGTNAAAVMDSGSHVISAPITLDSNAEITVAGANDTLTLSGGISGSSGLSLAGAGTLALAAVNSYSGGTLIYGGTLAINAAGALPLGSPVFNSGALAVNANNVSGAIVGSGTLSVGAASQPALLQLEGGSGLSQLSSLTIAPGSMLDITDNAVEINYGVGPDPAATIRGYLKSGYNNGLWTGTGIGSGTAAINPGLYAVGYVDGNTDMGTQAGAGQIFIEFTLAGDANLDGTVNFADLLVVAQNFNHTLDTHGNPIDWADGDFNYDGVVNFADLLLIAQNFNKALSTSQLAEVPGSFAADWQLALAEVQNSQDQNINVPEPASIGVLGVFAAGLLGRRRSKRTTI
ncbi:MAG: dockerin type I domain-containing protein [Tepidisphaeraceae bacterium]